MFRKVGLRAVNGHKNMEVFIEDKHAKIYKNVVCRGQLWTVMYLGEFAESPRWALKTTLPKEREYPEKSTYTSGDK